MILGRLLCRDPVCRRRACQQPASAHLEAGRPLHLLVLALPRATCCVFVAENMVRTVDEMSLILTLVLRRGELVFRTTGTQITVVLSAPARTSHHVLRQHNRDGGEIRSEDVSKNNVVPETRRVLQRGRGQNGPAASRNGVPGFGAFLSSNRGRMTCIGPAPPTPAERNSAALGGIGNFSVVCQPCVEGCVLANLLSRSRS